MHKPVTKVLLIATRIKILLVWRYNTTDAAVSQYFDKVLFFLQAGVYFNKLLD